MNRELLDEALRLAEQGASRLRYIRDGADRYESERLFEAWDKLQAAAQCTQEMQITQQAQERRHDTR